MKEMRSVQQGAGNGRPAKSAKAACDLKYSHTATYSKVQDGGKTECCRSTTVGCKFVQGLGDQGGSLKCRIGD